MSDDWGAYPIGCKFCGVLTSSQPHRPTCPYALEARPMTMAMCEHANEVPRSCWCPLTCVCRRTMCHTTDVSSSMCRCGHALAYHLPDMDGSGPCANGWSHPGGVVYRRGLPRARACQCASFHSSADPGLRPSPEGARAATGRQSSDSPLLRGIILREEGAELVVRATEGEVAAFGAGREVHLAPTTPAVEPSMLAGETLYDRNGNPVCIVTDVSMSVDRVDMTSMGDVVRNYVSGLITVDIRASGVPGWPARRR